MDVLDAGDYLLKELASLLLWNSSFLHDVVEEFASTGVLHDQVKLARCLNDFIQLDDVGVSDQFEDVDFSRHSFNVSHVANAVLLEYFDRDVLFCQLVLPFAHLSKSAFSYFFLDVVVADHSSSLNRLGFRLLSIDRLVVLHLFLTLVSLLRW